MKLSIDEDQDRPEALTENLFIMLMAAEIKRKGVFQIINFTRKREKVYSTKISDGFFVIKTMIVSDAADQIEKGCIKIHSILQGWIRNHGEGVIVIKQPMKFWKYDSAVGDAKPWKLKKQNINTKGSSIIFWDRNPLMSQTASENKPQNNTSLKQAGNLSNHTNVLKNYRHLLSSSKQKSTLKISEQDQPNIEQKIEYKQIKDITINEHLKQETSSFSQLEQTQSLQKFNQQKKTQNEPSTSQPSKKSKIDQILSLILSDSQDQQQQKQQICPTAQKKLKQSSGRKKSSQKKIDLKFIFDNLDSQQSIDHNEDSKLQRQQTKQIIKDKVEDEDSEESFMIWMQHKSKMKMSPKQQLYDQQKAQQQRSKRIQQYLELQTQLSNLYEERTDPQEKNLQQQSQFYPNDKIISVSDVYHGLFISSIAYWWTRINIICLNYINQDQNYLQAIISDQSRTYLMNTVFTNITDSQIELQEGCQYRFTKGVIRYLIQNYYKGCSYQLEFDCKQCHILLEQNPDNLEENSNNYCPISKIGDIDEGLLINVFGVLKKFKTMKAKTGVTYNYELVDPLSKWSISLIHFQSNFSSQYIKNSVQKGITAYGVQIGSFKGKRNLTLKPSSIVKFQWLPYTKQAIQIRSWIDEGHNILEVETQLLGFVDIGGLRDIEDELSNNIHIKNVTVIEFKEKFTYRACTKCLKKMEETKCRSCGVRNNDEIFDRVFLRGSLGDWSATVNVIWSQAAADIMLIEGFQAMQSSWLLKQVQLWLEKGSNGTLTVIRMRRNSLKERLSDLLCSINKNLI